jgi:hypothetical protein
VVRACHPQATWEAKIRRLMVLGQQRQKFLRPPSQWEKVLCGGTGQSTQLQWEAEDERLMVQSGVGIKQDPIFKITRERNWRCSSGSTVLAYQVWSPELKIQYHQNKQTKTEEYQCMKVAVFVIFTTSLFNHLVWQVQKMDAFLENVSGLS